MNMSTPSVMAVYISMFRVCMSSSRHQTAARFADKLPGNPVGLHDFLQGPRSGDRNMVQRFPDQGGDLMEPNLVPQEELHRNLVRGVQNRGGRPAAGERLVREIQTLEFGEVRLEESHLLQLAEVDSLGEGCRPLRVGESILDRDLHVGHPELGLHRSVDELHHRMNDRLRMDQDVYLRGRET